MMASVSVTVIATNNTVTRKGVHVVIGLSLFEDNFVLNSFLSVFTHTLNDPVKSKRKLQTNFARENLTVIITSVIFADMTLELERVGPVFSSVNQCPSVRAICCYRRQKTVSMPKFVLNNKTGLFLELN